MRTNKKRATGKHLFPIWAALAMGSWLLAGSSNADDLSDETGYYAELPVVITATRLSQSIAEAPVSMTIIDQAMIEAAGAVELADLLRLVPGFQVAYSTRDAAFAVSYHGQADGFPRRLQVLIDGRAVYGAAFSHVDWVTLGVQLDDIERIEVVRGSNTPVFGANAFIAVVNIITKASFQQPGLQLGVTVGNGGDQHLFTRYAGVDNEHYTYRLSAGYRNSDGLENRNDEYELTSLDYRGDIDMTDRDRLQVGFGFMAGPMGRGGSNILLPVGTKAARNEYEYGKWSRAFNHGESVLQLYHNRHWEHDTYSLMPLSALINVQPETIPDIFPGQEDQMLEFGLYDYSGERLDLEWQYLSLPASNGLRVSLGSGARLDRLRSAILINEGDSWVYNRSLRLFGNAEYRPAETMVLNVGLLTEWSEIAGIGLSPRIGFNYQVADNHVLRTTLTRSLRNPSLLENNFDYGLRFNDGSPLDVIHYSFGNLDPEKLVSAELAYLWRAYGGRLLGDVKLFRERFTDEIEEIRYRDFAEPLGIANKGVYLRKNGGKTTISGLEGGVRLNRDGDGLVALSFSLAKADEEPSKTATRGDDDYTRSGTPTLTAGLLVNQPLSESLTAGLALYRQTGMAWYGDGSDVKGYTRVDFNIRRRFRIAGSPVMLAFILQNLGSDHMEFENPEPVNASGKLNTRDKGLFSTRAYIRASLELR